MVKGSCNSCGKPLLEKGSTIFLCPSCGKSNTGRCSRCRDKSAQYVCPICGFRGP